MTILNPPQITTQLTGANFRHSLKDTKHDLMSFDANIANPLPRENLPCMRE